jgi:hypothetical protein
MTLKASIKKKITRLYDTFINHFLTIFFAFLPIKRKERCDKFFIFAQGRTGSKLLTDLLNSHENIHCDKELFNKSFYLGSGNFFSPKLLLEGKLKLYSKKTYGFKDKIYQIKEQKKMEPSQFIHELNINNWKIIYLKRENLFKHVLSSEIAKMRKQFHAYAYNTQNDFGKIHINPDDILRKMKRRERYHEQEMQILKDIPHLEFTYEDDLLNPEKQQQTASKIFKYLNLKDKKVTTRFRKVNTKDNKNLIANYHEIKEALKDTPYEEWLEK